MYFLTGYSYLTKVCKDFVITSSKKYKHKKTNYKFVNQNSLVQFHEHVTTS